MATLRRQGMLPWRTSELFGDLRRTFEGVTRGSQYGQSDLILFSGAVGHYMQDAHQPFHASINYDGQLTGNTGIHARFERDLMEKFQSRLIVKPAPPKAILNPRDAAFDALLAGYLLVDPILAADTSAVAGRDAYDADYSRSSSPRCVRFSSNGSPSRLLPPRRHHRAWEQAGRPALSFAGARPIEK